MSIQFISNLASKPFPYIDIYDRVRVDVLVRRIIDSIYPSMIWEQYFYNVLSRLNSYACRLNNKEKAYFVEEALSQGFDISNSAMAKAQIELDEALSEVYNNLYGDDSN